MRERTPPRSGKSPRIVLKSVVLPEPFGPASANELAGIDRQVDALQHRRRIVAEAGILERNQRESLVIRDSPPGASYCIDILSQLHRLN